MRQEIEEMKLSKECILEEIRNCQRALDAVEDSEWLLSSSDVEYYIDALEFVSVLRSYSYLAEKET